MGSRTTKRNRSLKALDNIRDSASVEPLSGDAKRERARRQSSVTQSGDEVGSGTTLDLAVEPVRLEIDRGALPLDSCQSVKSDPLPATYVEQPYQHHFGLTFLGIEYWGFNFTGNFETAARSPDRRRSLSVRLDRDGHPSKGTGSCGGVGGPKGGLRVRVGKT
jgi:hypothetical protein